MKSRYIIFICVALILFASGFLFTKNENPLINYSNSTYKISFSYPDNYVLSENDSDASHHIVLINKNNLPIPENSDGPETITIDMYQNSNGFTTEGWIKNSKKSNWRLGDGTISTTTIDNVPAMSYRWSGLYEGTTIAVAQPNFIYAFSVTYNEIGAPIVQDFVTIRDSVKISP